MDLVGLVTFAVEAAGEEEPSKTGFYLVGGVLAAYAVLISFLGLRGGATFPGTPGARAGVMAVSTVLVLAAMASAILTS
jgi:hypothetical protein